MEDFCRAVRTGSTPLSSVEIGLDVVRMIEAVDRSLAASGARVETATGPDAELPQLEVAAKSESAVGLS